MNKGLKQGQTPGFFPIVTHEEITRLQKEFQEAQLEKEMLKVIG